MIRYKVIQFKDDADDTTMLILKESLRQLKIAIGNDDINSYKLVFDYKKLLKEFTEEQIEISINNIFNSSVVKYNSNEENRERYILDYSKNRIDKIYILNFYNIQYLRQNNLL